MDDRLMIEVLLGSGIIGTIITVIASRLASKRAFQHAIDQKMIDRISYLSEHYYSHISRSSDILQLALLATLKELSNDRIAAHFKHLSFYTLSSYLQDVERLSQERPRPLLTEIKEEIKYLEKVNDVSNGLPFDFCEESLIIQRSRKDGRMIPAHEFVMLIQNDQDMRRCYEKFSDWIQSCRCRDEEDESCDVHRVIKACFWICNILEEQIQKAYYDWYKRPKKTP